jgi:hypothetical protein
VKKVQNHVRPDAEAQQNAPCINTADNPIYSEILKELIDSVEGTRKYFGAQEGKKTDCYGANRQRQETYDANGCVSVIIARSDLPTFANLRASTSTPLVAPA